MSALSHASRLLLAGLVLWLGVSRSETLGQESAPPLIKKTLNEDEPKGPNEAVVAISRFQARYGIELGIEKQPDRIFVKEVDPQKYAARVGLEKGDIVVAVEGRPTSTMDQVVAALQQTEQLSSVEMQLRRGDKDITVLMGKHLSLPGLVIREDASHRAYASRVSNESLEGNSEIQTGDLIMGVNDQSTATYEQFVLIAVPTLQEMRAGEELSLQVIRDGTRHRVAIVRPDHVDLPALDIETTQRPDKVEHRAETRDGQVRGAVAVIYPVTREETPAAAQVTQRVRVFGEIRLEARADSELDVLGQIVGLPEGSYEVLVHQFGDCRNVVEGSVGPTFDTGDTRDRDRTPGSLGTLEVLRDGVGTITSATKSFRLNGQHSIIGRAVVVYPILTENGRLGEPLACGVIGIAN